MGDTQIENEVFTILFLLSGKALDNFLQTNEMRPNSVAELTNFYHCKLHDSLCLSLLDNFIVVLDFFSMTKILLTIGLV